MTKHTLIFVLLSGIFLSGCAGSSFNTDEPAIRRIAPLPRSIVERLDRAFRITAGEKTWERYYGWDEDSSGIYTGTFIANSGPTAGLPSSGRYYRIRIFFRAPETQWMAQRFEWIVESDTRIDASMFSARFPHCPAESDPCVYIDSLKAVAIARAGGIMTSIEPMYAVLTEPSDGGIPMSWMVTSVFERGPSYRKEDRWLIDLVSGAVTKKFIHTVNTSESHRVAR